MKDEITEEMLLSSLTQALRVCPPDEYQMRHNLLVRQIAKFILKDKIAELEGEIE
jgi:hypothetical protein